jgi:hypothetical protein
VHGKKREREQMGEEERRASLGEGNRAWPHGKEDHGQPYRKVGERVLRCREDGSRRESASRKESARHLGEANKRRGKGTSASHGRGIAW